MFRRVYPQTGQIVLDGGKNSNFERSIIADNESPDCQNVVFINGAVETREGAQRLNTAAIGSFAFDGLYTRHDNDGAETMIAFAGGSAWQLVGTSFTTIASAQSLFTAGARVCASEAEDHIFVGNGGIIPHKYNGSAFTRHGIYPPTSTHTVATGAAGVLTGDYRYKVTWVNSALVESDVGPVNTTIAVAGTKITVGSIPTAPQSYGVASRRLYRTVTSGTVFKRLVELSDNTTTTYDDNIADASLGATAPTDNGVPPIYSVSCYHQGRLFMNDVNNPNLMWYSELGNPYVVATTNFISVGDKSGDTVAALSVYNNGVRIGGKRGDYIVYMPDTDPANWQLIKVKSDFGVATPFCLLDYNNRQLYGATRNGKFAGFASLAGDTAEQTVSLLTVLAAGSDLTSAPIEPDMFNVSSSLKGNISGIVFNNRAYISVPYGSGATENNRIYYLDFSISDASRKQKVAWVPFTGLNAAQFTVYANQLYYGSSTANGYVYRLESGTYNDDGAAIDSYFWSKEFSGFSQDVNLEKDFRYLNLLIERTGDYYMNITWRTNSDSGVGTTVQQDLDPGGTKWGTMVWGTDSWGGFSSQQNVQIKLGSARGKRIQFKFSNQNVANQRFKVHYMNFTYNPKGIR